MEPARRDITIRQGSTFKKLWRFRDISAYPLAGREVRAQIRDADLSTVIVDLTVGNGRIVVNPSLGTILMTIDKTTTAAIPSQMAKWDMECEYSGEVDPLFEGDCYIGPEVTK